MPPPDRIRRLTDRLEPRLRRIVLAALKDLPAGLVETLTAAVEAQDVRGILAAIREMPTEEIRRVLLDAVNGAKGITGATYGIRFDLTDPNAVLAAERHAAQLVTEVTQETRRAIAAIVADGIREGVPPREQARQIARIVGLTERDARAVDSLWRRMIADGVVQAQADSRAQRYADRLLRARAENIARTETIRASTEGTRQGWEAAAREGYVDTGTARIVWIVTQDDRLCARCAPMAGVAVGFTDKFTATTEATGDLARNKGGTAPYTGATRPLGEHTTVEGPPLHPRCRCSLGLVV
jgi:hypothetical protein